MERVSKVFFDPLARSKAQIREILNGLPIGSAHPFSPERVLLCRVGSGNIVEIDISSYPDDYFFNAVDLGDMGEVLLERIACYPNQLEVFKDFQIQQAPTSTFKIPILSKQITIFAVSVRNPTYWDLCLADSDGNTSCFSATDTFDGMLHSGDLISGITGTLLQHIKLDPASLTEKEICVLISGFRKIPITKFLGTNPALLVANHEDKVLYIIPVPLDTATINDSTICCPMVVKRDGESLICSILPTATTDRNKECDMVRLASPCFKEAIRRADFKVSSHVAVKKGEDSEIEVMSNPIAKSTTKDNALISTNSTTVPSFIDLQQTQLIHFGTGISFKMPGEELSSETKSSAVILPCIFGSQLQGPSILATGTIPSNVPFDNGTDLRRYYDELKNVIVIVDDKMTDNARNLASSYRINALFIVQLKLSEGPSSTDRVLTIMNSANINAVTALAGPQSLVLVQIGERFYFYRGIANRTHLDTSKLAFGSDVTSFVFSLGKEPIIDPRVTRIVNLNSSSSILLPTSEQFIQPKELPDFFTKLPVDKIQDLEEDISAAVPQLQMILDQREIQELSGKLISILQQKVSTAVAPYRDAYIKFVTEEFHPSERPDPEMVKKKNRMLGDFRKNTELIQKAIKSAISSLANMMSSQMTSKRTHDLKKLARQTQIKGNVEAATTMTFDKLAAYLEQYAEEMGVMLLNIKTTPYRQLLGSLRNATIDASPCCALESRILHLGGLDAGIIMEQSQNHHEGPLRSQGGPSSLTMALPNLAHTDDRGSMLAWVCWDEFVNLRSPFMVRWLDKCNERHISALRIIMRATLSQAVASREFNIQPQSQETGHLMSSLLMAAMSKLAAMRTSAPIVADKAEDTTTKLMRGLFGNLLTMAGSGTRPQSMVWQLFGMDPIFDIPTTDVDWMWYHTVVDLYPYTGWPVEQFHDNLVKLLDKIIVRVVTKNEVAAKAKSGASDDMIYHCKLRNIQLDHSRTIITILMRMLTEEGIDTAAVATRLLKNLPRRLSGQSPSYPKMIEYLKRLSKGGERGPHDDIIAAMVYANRSAAFSELKNKVYKSCISEDWVKMKEHCQELLDEHCKIATLWKVKPEDLKIQNLQAYKDLLRADFGAENKNLELIHKVSGDAERRRVAWQVGKRGQFSDPIEPLDEDFVYEILTGEKDNSAGKRLGSRGLADELETMEITASKKRTIEDEFDDYSSSLTSAFVNKMQKKELSGKAVCDMIKVPVSAMRVFVKALNPDFVWEDLADSFKEVILGLLKNRSGRVESRPTRRLLRMGDSKKQMQIEN
ncbi:hypothetical protein HYFRA_00000702 [Hymenoscyphus fraxineus]|uniref:Uncharacterized protein n=1 Tax=Hymenoscyphus fraxineus TaxID=746836 RepID=A0A9N9PRY6_9HELO|nr:hypothetical protein HYFRA_00000702 [Hymenoscyphus fraxineus]